MHNCTTALHNFISTLLHNYITHHQFNNLLNQLLIMPAIHGSLTDIDFDAFGKIAEARGMSRSDLVTSLAKAEILKLSKEGKGGEE